MMGSFSGVAGGNISPARFVKRGEDADGEPVLTLCGAGESPWGISTQSTHRRSFFGSDDGYAAVAGEHFNVFGPGDDQAPLELGGTVTAGQYIKASTNGVGVAATSNLDQVGAQAVRGGVSGDIIPVKPIRFDRSI